MVSFAARPASPPAPARDLRSTTGMRHPKRTEEHAARTRGHRASHARARAPRECNGQSQKEKWSAGEEAAPPSRSHINTHRHEQRREEGSRSPPLVSMKEPLLLRQSGVQTVRNARRDVCVRERRWRVREKSPPYAGAYLSPRAVHASRPPCPHFDSLSLCSLLSSAPQGDRWGGGAAAAVAGNCYLQSSSSSSLGALQIVKCLSFAAARARSWAVSAHTRVSALQPSNRERGLVT